MKLSIDRGEFMRGLGPAAGVSEKGGSMPILGSVLLAAEGGEVTITASDLEVSFRTRIEADIEVDGRTTVPARKLLALLKALPDESVRLELVREGLTIRGGRSVHTLRTMPPDDFPSMPDLSHVNWSELPSEQLGAMIVQTVYAVSSNEVRYNVSGVYFEAEENRLRMTGTDGHRLATVETEGHVTLTGGRILPPKGLVSLLRLTKEYPQVRLGFSDNCAAAESGAELLVMRLLEGRFPNYQAVIPKGLDKIVSVGRVDLMGLVRRATILTDGPVALALATKELTASAADEEFGVSEERLAVDYEGYGVRVGCNPKYLLDALGSMTADVVTLSLKSTQDPMTVAGDPGLLAVIMPVKIGG